MNLIGRAALIAVVLICAGMGATREPEGNSFRLYFSEFSVAAPPVGLWEPLTLPEGQKGLLRRISSTHVVAALAMRVDFGRKWDPAGPEWKTADQKLKFQGLEFVRRSRTSSPFVLLSFASSGTASGSLAAKYCASFELTARQYGVPPDAPDEFRLETEVGWVCPLPQHGIAAILIYGEGRAQTDASLPELHSEAQQYLTTLEIQPPDGH